MFPFSAQARLSISEEEFEFLQLILAIPLVQRSWKRLVTFDSLQAFVANQVQRISKEAIHSIPMT